MPTAFIPSIPSQFEQRAPTARKCFERQSMLRPLIILLVSLSWTLMWSNLARCEAPFSVIHAFDSSSDGAYPTAGLTVVGSTLYGTTPHGGNTGYGTIFSIGLDGSGFRTLHAFGGSDGASSHGDLTVVGSTLYGTTALGGDGNGTIFSIGLDGSGFQTLHAFKWLGSEGAAPFAGLTLVGSTLYGTTSQAASNGGGSIFSIGLDGSGFQTLHAFDYSSDFSSDGAIPYAGLTLGGSTLYGTASHGGNNGSGTIFSIGLDGGDFQILHAFDYSSDGSRPAALTLVGSTLYGITTEGASDGGGTIFSIGLDGSGFQTLHAFDYSAGANPGAGLTAVGSNLYGITVGGGYGHSGGTIFSIGLDGSGFQTLHAFDGAGGFQPIAGLTAVGSTLYGTTMLGGINGSGTIFLVAVPEPTSLVTAIIGLVGASLIFRRRRQFKA